MMSRFDFVLRVSQSCYFEKVSVVSESIRGKIQFFVFTEMEFGFLFVGFIPTSIGIVPVSAVLKPNPSMGLQISNLSTKVYSGS